MGCGVYWQQVHEVEGALSTMDKYGIDPSSEAYVALTRTRGTLLADIGRKFPRVTIPITHEAVLGRLETLGLVYAGYSPGFTIEELKDAIVTVWFDVESGWMSEARFKPGSPPIYRSITAEEAASFIKHEETPGLIARVFTEEYYYGE